MTTFIIKKFLTFEKCGFIAKYRNYTQMQWVCVGCAIGSSSFYVSLRSTVPRRLPAGGASVTLSLILTKKKVQIRFWHILSNKIWKSELAVIVILRYDKQCTHFCLAAAVWGPWQLQGSNHFPSNRGDKKDSTKRAKVEEQENCFQKLYHIV